MYVSPTTPTTSAQRDELQAALDRLRGLEAQGPVDAQHYADQLADEMHRLLAWPCSVFRVSPTESGWSTDFFAVRGVRARDAERYVEALASTRTDFLLHDPLHPPARSRNVVESLTPDDLARAPASASILRQMGLGDRGGLRTLVCDGPLLLASLVVFRADGPRRDAQVLGQLARAARVPLRRARRLNVRRLGPVLETLLLTYPGEAFALCPDGRIELANEAGSRRLAETGGTLVRDLARAARAYPRPVEGWELQPVRTRGQPLLLVALRRTQASPDLEGRLNLAKMRWNLTPRHLDVLRSLALGYSNKLLAANLQMSTRTAEQHVAQILDRTQSDSRLQLVSRLWRGG